MSSFNGLTPIFQKRFMLFNLDGDPEMRREKSDRMLKACHYPCAYEYSGMLLVIAALSYEDSTRAAVMHRVRLDGI